MVRPVMEITRELQALGCRSVPEEVISVCAAQLPDNEPLIGAIYGAQWRRGDGNDVDYYRCLLVFTKSRFTEITAQLHVVEPHQILYTFVSYMYLCDVARVDFSADPFGYGEHRLTLTGYTDHLGRMDMVLHASKKGINVSKAEFAQFCEQLRGHVEQIRSIQGGKPGPASLVLNQLERLAALKQSGALTEEEFRIAKMKLLMSD
jgi:hypothetical protein